MTYIMFVLLGFTIALFFVFVATSMIFDCFGYRLKDLIKQALIEIYKENRRY